MELINNSYSSKVKSIQYCKAFFQNIEEIFSVTTHKVAIDIFEKLFPQYCEDIELVIHSIDELINRRKATEWLGNLLIQKQFDMLTIKNARGLKPLL